MEKHAEAKCLLKNVLWVQESKTAEITFFGVTIVLPTTNRGRSCRAVLSSALQDMKGNTPAHWSCELKHS